MKLVYFYTFVLLSEVTELDNYVGWVGLVKENGHTTNSQVV